MEAKPGHSQFTMSDATRTNVVGMPAVLGCMRMNSCNDPAEALHGLLSAPDAQSRDWHVTRIHSTGSRSSSGAYHNTDNQHHHDEVLDERHSFLTLQVMPGSMTNISFSNGWGLMVKTLPVSVVSVLSAARQCLKRQRSSSSGNSCK